MKISIELVQRMDGGRNGVADLATIGTAEEMGVGDQGFFHWPACQLLQTKGCGQRKLFWEVFKPGFISLPSWGWKGLLITGKTTMLTASASKPIRFKRLLMAYLVPHSPVSPYVLGGTGWYFTQVKGPVNRNGNRQSVWPARGRRP
jgi:hypothetical protein